MLKNINVNKENVKEVIENAVDWIKEILKTSKAKGIILGMSGGIDCSVVARLCQIATSNVTLVLMPYGESMKRTGDKNHAMKLINKFGFDYFEVDITNSVNTIRNSITAYKDINIEGLPVNNIKPRVRMTILYTIGQSKDYLVAGTGNLSEEVMGYFTKWGDGACDFNPIGSFTKTEVRLIARELGIPNEIIDKAPSAGLWTGQTDEEEMGVAYEDIDNFIINGESSTKEATAKIKRAYEITKHKRTPIPIFMG
ncbi:TPA: NAD(+) synthase [Clostridium botulinum]|nr:NAD(+) synthase [Clostridium botulinum]